MKTIYPAQVCGTITAPSSKSLMQRAIAAGLLSDESTTIYNPSFCADSLAALNVAAGLGAEIVVSADSVVIKGGLKYKQNTLDCGESGLCIRSFAPIAALLDQQITLNGSGSLANRPLEMIEIALNQLGAMCLSNNGRLPLIIRGRIQGGKATIDGSVSSQLLTGLLFALPVADNDSEIYVTNLKSRPYIDLTIELLKDFGITVQNDNYSRFYIAGRQKYLAKDYNIEGDWSGAAFILVAGAIAGSVTVTNLNSNSKQADCKILDALTAAGAKIEINDQEISVFQADLKAFNFAAGDCPDLFPPLAVLAACCDGVSKISGVHRLQHKESNRGLVICEEFAKLGVCAKIVDDEMLVYGDKIHGGVISSHNDHRIAMSGAVLALRASEPVQISGWQAVDKSYNNFYRDLENICV